MSVIEPGAKGYLPRSPLLKGLLLAFFITLFVTFLLAILFKFTKLSEQYLSSMASFVLAISVIGGGMWAAKITEARFVLTGLGVGSLYLLIIIAISIFGGSSVSMTALGLKALYCCGGGLLGGILGAVFK